MDLRRLSYFVAVAEERNIGRAAQRLNISQPPLTRQIQQLEAEIGSPLLVRGRRGVETTAAGQVLLEDAKMLLKFAERARLRSRFAGDGQLGRLDIGVIGSNILALPGLLGRFRESHPQVIISIQSMTKDAQILALQERRITAGFNLRGSPLADIESEVMCTEPLLLAVSAGSKFVRKPRLRLADLTDEPMVLYANGARPNLIDAICELCRAHGFEPHISQEVPDSITAIAMVAAGYGISLVPRPAAQLRLPGVVYRRFPDEDDLTIDVNCIYRKGDTSPVLQAFLDTVRPRRLQPRPRA